MQNSYMVEESAVQQICIVQYIKLTQASNPQMKMSNFIN